jgi:hypothetical protein
VWFISTGAHKMLRIEVCRRCSHRTCSLAAPRADQLVVYAAPYFDGGSLKITDLGALRHLSELCAIEAA